MLSFDILVKSLKHFASSMRPLRTQTFNYSFTSYHWPNVDALTQRQPRSICRFSLNHSTHLGIVLDAPLFIGNFSIHTHQFVESNLQVLKDKVHTGLFTIIFEPSLVHLVKTTPINSPTTFSLLIHVLISSLQISPREAQQRKTPAKREVWCKDVQDSRIITFHA